MFSNCMTHLAFVAQVPMNKVFKSLVQIASIRTAHANKPILVLSLTRGASAKPPETKFIFPLPHQKEST